MRYDKFLLRVSPGSGGGPGNTERRLASNSPPRLPRLPSPRLNQDPDLACDMGNSPARIQRSCWRRQILKIRFTKLYCHSCDAQLASYSAVHYAARIGLEQSMREGE